jgi:hypothetical protein
MQLDIDLFQIIFSPGKPHEEGKERIEGRNKKKKKQTIISRMKSRKDDKEGKGQVSLESP